jgi:hypothetical protein
MSAKIIAVADEYSFFIRLKEALEAKLYDWNDRWEKGGFITNHCLDNDIDKSIVFAESSLDATLYVFMIEHFGIDFAENRVFKEFYECVAPGCLEKAIQDAEKRLNHHSAMQ